MDGPDARRGKPAGPPWRGAGSAPSHLRSRTCTSTGAAATAPEQTVIRTPQAAADGNATWGTHGPRSEASGRRDRRTHRAHRERPGMSGASTRRSRQTCVPGPVVERGGGQTGATPEGARFAKIHAHGGHRREIGLASTDLDEEVPIDADLAVALPPTTHLPPCRRTRVPLGVKLSLGSRPNADTSGPPAKGTAKFHILPRPISGLPWPLACLSARVSTGPLIAVMMMSLSSGVVSSIVNGKGPIDASTFVGGFSSGPKQPRPPKDALVQLTRSNVQATCGAQRGRGLCVVLLTQPSAGVVGCV